MISNVALHKSKNGVLAPYWDSALIEKTESGSVVSFSDGGDGMPMVSVVADIDAVQSGTGDPSPSNVRPISGWDSVNVTRTGKNLFDVNGETSFIYSDIAITNGVIAISSIGSGATSRVYFAKTYTAGTYTFSAKFSRSINSVRLYSPISFTGGTYNAYYQGYFTELSNGSITVTFAEDFSIGVIAQGVSRETGTIYDIQLEVGSTATAYEPYTAQTYPTTLPQTVYGGHVDIVKGELVITHKRQVFNGTENWSMAQTGYFVIAKSSVDANLDTTEVYSDTMISNYLPFGNNQPTAYPSFNANTTLFRVSMPDLTTLDAFKAYLGTNNLEIIVKYATPQTIQLTPQEVDSLLADNNVWADSGNIAVVYRADSTLAYNALLNALGD